MNSGKPHAVDLLLASRSPRRVDLLATLGVSFAVFDVEVDEAARTAETPQDYVVRLALAKAMAGRARQNSVPVLSADTAVVAKGQILGKPLDFADSKRMLALLADDWHEVLTGVALVGAETASCCVSSRVRMRALSPAEMAAYWRSGEPRDKAGGYAIQGLAGAFIERLDGSYSNVVGLPLCETLSLLNRFKIPHALSRQPSAEE